MASALPRLDFSTNCAAHDCVRGLMQSSDYLPYIAINIYFDTQLHRIVRGEHRLIRLIF